MSLWICPIQRNKRWWSQTSGRTQPMAGTETDPQPLQEGKEIRGAHSTTHGVCSQLAARMVEDQDLVDRPAVEEGELHLQEAEDHPIPGEGSRSSAQPAQVEGLSWGGQV